MTIDAEVITRIGDGSLIHKCMRPNLLYQTQEPEDILEMWGVRLLGSDDANRNYVRVRYPETWSVIQGKSRRTFHVLDGREQFRLTIRHDFLLHETYVHSPWSIKYYTNGPNQLVDVMLHRNKVTTFHTPIDLYEATSNAAQLRLENWSYNWIRDNYPHATDPLLYWTS